MSFSHTGLIAYAWRVPGCVEPSGHGTMQSHPALHEILSAAAARRAETEHLTALLLWALYHAQDASSPVGQPIRRALGLGAFDPLTEEQVRAGSDAAAHAMRPSVEAETQPTAAKD